jgi:hypothetical protein
LSLNIGLDLDVKVAGGCEETKTVLIRLFRILLSSDSCEFGEVDLMAEFGFIVVFIDGEEVRSKDDVDWFPILQREHDVLA